MSIHVHSCPFLAIPGHLLSIHALPLHSLSCAVSEWQRFRHTQHQQPAPPSCPLCKRQNTNGPSSQDPTSNIKGGALVMPHPCNCDGQGGPVVALWFPLEGSCSGGFCASGGIAIVFRRIFLLCWFRSLPGHFWINFRPFFFPLLSSNLSNPQLLPHIFYALSCFYLLSLHIFIPLFHRSPPPLNQLSISSL